MPCDFRWILDPLLTAAYSVQSFDSYSVSSPLMGKQEKIKMRIIGKFHLAAVGAAVALAGCASQSTQSDLTWQNADIHTATVILTEPMMKVNGGYHELVDSYYLTPYQTDNKVIMASLDDMLDELNGDVTYNGDQVTYAINGHSVTMTVGSTTATIDGQEVTAPQAPTRVEGAVFAPFKFVFVEGFDAKYSWNSKRKQADASILRPPGSVFKSSKGPFSIKTIYKQEADWFGTDEAIAVANAMVANQNADGGWFKLGSSDDLSRVFDRDLFPSYRQKSSIDNDATYVQITTLAKVYSKTGVEAYKTAAEKGLEYLIDGQYAGGGWPQFFPNPTGYHRHITINDNAMSNVLTVLGDAAKQKGNYAFVSDQLAARAQASVDKGLQWLLDAQVVVNGKKTGWCAQYNVDTMACARGRSYELASISGGESVNIIRFLMSIENPSQDVINAVNSSIVFMQSLRIDDAKLQDVKDISMTYGKDRILIAKPGSAVWPRFIEVDTLKPLFSNRQGDRLYNYDEVGYERRVKYRWLVGAPKKMIDKEYPKWQAKYSPQYSALD
jgi:PelA/Pel-15E family pectate lyase